MLAAANHISESSIVFVVSFSFLHLKNNFPLALGALHCSHCVVTSMTTSSVMSVFPCLLYTSAVRASTSVPFFSRLKKFFCWSIFVWRLQNTIDTTPDDIRPISAVELGQAIGHPTNGHLLGLPVRAMGNLTVFHTRSFDRVRQLLKFMLLECVRSEQHHN